MEITILLRSVVLLVFALYILVKGADYFITAAEKLGTAFGLRPFLIGVVIVGMGTSLPELAASIAAVLSGANTMVLANVVGSNIANILLVGGVLAFVGGPILIKQKLLQTELPIFIIATIHFTAVVYDGVVDQVEAVLLVGTLLAYCWYLFYESTDMSNGTESHEPAASRQVEWVTVFLLITGLTAVLVGAKFTVDMTVAIATSLQISVAFISITAIAIGTSLPELVVSIQAVRKQGAEMAIGNIFGSSAFNMLAVAGLPALFVPLVADKVVVELGLGVMVAASIVLFVSGLARQIMRWEGLMLLLFFAFFIIKLFTLL